MNLIADHDRQMKVFHDIVGCAYDVYNEFRPGLTEYPYQYGLKHLLVKLGYNVKKEYPLPIYLFGEKLEESYRLDLVLLRPEDVGDVIIECKSQNCIIEEHRNQLRTYMLLTHCRYGILINFVKMEIKEYIQKPMNTIKRLMLLTCSIQNTSVLHMRKQSSLGNHI